jgi:hypothetical protein
MKNTFKWLGFIVVVAVIGVFFAACGEDEDIREGIIVNESKYDLIVRCAGSEPSEFPLKGIQAAEWDAGGTADSRKVTRVGKNIQVTGWEIADSGGSQSGVITDNSKAGYYYFRNDPSMSLSVEQ